MSAGEDRLAGELERLRDRIEAIDHELVTLMAERVALARRAGELKQAAGRPTLDPAREAVVVRRAGEAARRAGLDDEEVRAVFWRLIGLSRRAQTPPERSS